MLDLGLMEDYVSKLTLKGNLREWRHKGVWENAFVYSTWMSPLGDIYTCPPLQWTVEIDLIQRLILILHNAPYKYLRYLQA